MNEGGALKMIKKDDQPKMKDKEERSKDVERELFDDI